MNLRKILAPSILMASLLVLSLVAQAPAATLRPKVDNFILFFDHSGSMVLDSPDFSGLKLKMAKELAVRMTTVIPQKLGYVSGVNTFAPFATQLAPTSFTADAVVAAIQSIDAGYNPSRSTPMGFGLDKVADVLATLRGRTAIIIFTDGRNNVGMSPVAEAQALYNKYPSLCIHIVSYADTAHGKDVVAKIRALKACSIVGEPKALGSDIELQRFVREVFYEVVAD
jgi:OOP family OmpA-OmpF porin